MIVFDNVSKIFFNQTYGLKDVSFAIEPEEMVLVTGPTGSGKTTLMKLITKEYEANEGEIFFENTPLSKIRPHSLPLHRQRVGVIFQDYRLLPESNAWENIALPLMIAGKSKRKIEKRVTDLLKLVKLTDKSDLFPRELSGGEAQRVSIARALATAPPLIFADEPTGNLDKETAKSIVRLLTKINELGTTVLLSTHDVVVLEALKDIRKLELREGELINDTNPPEQDDQRQSESKDAAKEKKKRSKSKNKSKEKKPESSDQKKQKKKWGLFKKKNRKKSPKKKESKK